MTSWVCGNWWILPLRLLGSLSESFIEVPWPLSLNGRCWRRASMCLSLIAMSAEMTIAIGGDFCKHFLNLRLLR